MNLCILKKFFKPLGLGLGLVPLEAEAAKNWPRARGQASRPNIPAVKSREAAPEEISLEATAEDGQWRWCWLDVLRKTVPDTRNGDTKARSSTVDTDRRVRRTITDDDDWRGGTPRCLLTVRVRRRCLLTFPQILPTVP